ncbi:UDP-N-acetylmuramate dehydrogenase [Franconibacter pulveris]|uniref:UDP-N-acetylmuramate dehydrogenase n=1 Tax=Franconibacter pulveris TaxID=435910 RepID=UPI0009DCA405|nr:UDP-N-acetylmuramate dehydrogenase [Franconibacter pulveris]
MIQETTMSISLKPFNTFGIESQALKLVEVQTAEALIQTWREAQTDHLPVLILGEGSNVLFTENFDGVVIVNRIRGVTVREESDKWLLHVGAGENWHQLVEYTLERNMPGLENLALIPGCAGSSPIQNIGAYGVELKQVCDYVECVELLTGTLHRLPVEACRFGYRDSIFKHEYQDRFAITAVGFRLAKIWQPVLTYGDLTRFDPTTVTPRQVFDAVCHMRRTKLPDPRVNGNAGSFFKNPEVSKAQAATLLQAYPDAPHYPQKNGSVKLAAGWLIDKCQLKGHRIGGAAVHRQQALVLINEENATAEDIVRLARFIRQTVGSKFDIWLEPEVRFIGRMGEVSAVETIA